MMIIPVDAANAFFMLFNERGPINHLVTLAHRVAVRILLAVASHLGDATHHAVRDLAVDAVDVPHGAHRADEHAAKPDSRRRALGRRPRAFSVGSCFHCSPR